MRGITHLSVGLAAGAATAIVLPTESTGIMGGVLLATAVGSLFPDIDNTKSMLGKRIKPISYIINKLFGHRGFIHTPFNLLILMTACLCPMILTQETSGIPIAIGFGVGFLTHLFLDAITKGGISFLYPFTKKRFNLTTIRTGSIGEYVIIALFWIVTGIVIAVSILM